MNICFIPIDNRPVCYTLAKDITAVDENIKLFIPPREFMGTLTKTADIENILIWLKTIPECESVILSLDTLAYGGLIPSRRSNETFEQIKTRIYELKDILKNKNAKIYAFSSIIRISNNNYNEEEKEYWKDYGKSIFEYSYCMHKNGTANSSKIPDGILNDYLITRKRNFEINKIYLEWQKEGFFDTLVFSKDDCAEYGFNVQEAEQLNAMGGYIKTGADEIPLSLLARSIKKDIKVFVQYTEPDCTNLISNYEDVPIDKSVSGQLELCGFRRVNHYDEADIILIVNNFREKQGELVMGWNTLPYNKKFTPPDKPFAVADVRFANGADNAFAEELLKTLPLKNYLGFSGWNTSSNTIGSLLAEVKIAYKAHSYNKTAFKKLQMIRFLDDWAYQANVRAEIIDPCDISDLMKPYAERLSKIFKYTQNTSKTNYIYSYVYPWNRKFEIEISIN